MKIVKVLVSIALLVSLLLGVFYFLLQKQTDAILPDVMNASSGLFLESCEKDETCITAMNTYLPECREQFLMTETSVLTFKEEYNAYLFNTYSCVESKSAVKLPSFDAFMQRQKLEPE